MSWGRREARGSEALHAHADDISDALRREFVRHTIVGVVSSTRTVNAEAITVKNPARLPPAPHLPADTGGAMLLLLLPSRE